MTPSPAPEGTDGGAPTGHIVRVRALGTVVRLEAPGPAEAALLRQEWSRCLVEAPDAVEVPIPVTTGDAPADRWGYALATLTTRVAIEAAAGRLLMFHAAAVSDPDGRALVLVAPSGTGKTTAAAVLGRAGFGYLTDEAVAIDDGARVLPYPKPLSVVQASGGKVQHGPDELGLGATKDDASVRRVVLLDRGSEGVPPRLERVPLLDALVALIPQTSALPSLARPLQRLCDLADRCGGVYRLTYGQIGEAAGLLGALLAGPVGPTEPWSVLAPPPDDLEGRVRTGLRRVACLDAVRAGGEALLLVGSLPVRLSPVGLSVWLAVDGAAALSDLVAAAVRDHGPHPDALAVVRDAVQRMLDLGALAGSLAPR